MCIALYGYNLYIKREYPTQLGTTILEHTQTFTSGSFSININGVVRISAAGSTIATDSRRGIIARSQHSMTDKIATFSFYSPFGLYTAGGFVPVVSGDPNNLNFACFQGSPENIERFVSSVSRHRFSVYGPGDTEIYNDTPVLLQTDCPPVNEDEGGGNYYGSGSPPPPRRKKECDCMDCGCSCNDVATMLARQLGEQARLFEGLKDHIDRRVKEEIVIHGKQLSAMTVDLQPVIDRVNEAENNLWNGVRQQ